jgi:2-methylcitrate dehydratase PrpD
VYKVPVLAFDTPNPLPYVGERRWPRAGANESILKEFDMGACEQRLAKFVTETSPDTIPPESYRAALQASFDCIGVALAGAAQPHGRMIVDFVAAQGGNSECTIIGNKLRTSPYFAALANGTLGHALDYDDMGGFGHPTVVLLPAALALGEQLGKSGRDILAAYVLGFEAAVHLSKGAENVQGLTGFHSTAVFGTISATAVAARLLELTAQQTVMAFGLAGSMPSGILQNFGSYTKPLHAGMACRSGVMAAALAKQGWYATDSFLDSKVGWAHAYIGENRYDPEKMTASLGKTWHSKDTIVIKKYPCCGSNHGALDSLIALLKEHDVKLDDIARVEVDNVPAISHVLLHPNPTKGYQGKFSLHYNIATALVDRKIDIDSFTDAKLNRPEYREAREKTSVNVMSNWDPQYEHAPTYTPVTITLKNGERLSKRTNRRTMHGAPADPLSEQELKDKFRSCARLCLPEKQVEEAIDAWWSLDRAPRLAEALQSVTPR